MINEDVDLLLIEEFFDELWLDEKDDDDNTGMHIAAKYGFFSLVKKLIRAKVSLNIPNKQGHTPLHLAIMNNHEMVAVLLVKHGADYSMIDEYGNNCLHIAATIKHKRMLQYFLHLGVNPNEQNIYEETPIHCLLEDPSPHVGESYIVDMAKLLIQANADLDFYNCAYQTILHMAAQNFQPQVAKLLLDNDAAPNQFNNQKQTPLHHAIDEPYLALVMIMGGCNLGKSEIEYQAEWMFNNRILFGFPIPGIPQLNKLSGISKRLLMLAIRRRKTNCYKLLLYHGTKLFAYTYAGPLLLDSLENIKDLEALKNIYFMALNKQLTKWFSARTARLILEMMDVIK